MPDDVADAANIVIDYFKRENNMLMDVFPEEEEIEYEEEEGVVVVGWWCWLLWC